MATKVVRLDVATGSARHTRTERRHRDVIGPRIDVDLGMIAAGAADDEQPTDRVLAHVAERHRRDSVGFVRRLDGADPPGLGRRPVDVPRQALRATCSAPQRAACARSTFDHPPPGLSDPDAPDRLPISLDGLALCRCCESGADEAGQRAPCNAVGEHDHFGGAERTAGEQLECPALLRVDATLSRADTVIHSHSYDMRWKCADGLSSVNLQAPAGRHL